MDKFIRVLLVVLFTWFNFIKGAQAACDDGTYDSLSSYNNITAYSNGACTGGGCGECQCVEYVKRFYDISVPLGNGHEVCNNLASNHGFTYYASGSSTTQPQPGDVLCFSGSTYGHVGIIKSVSDTEVVMIDQNRSSTDAEIDLALTKTGNAYAIATFGSGYTTLGWSRDPNFLPEEASSAIQSKADELWDIRPTGSGLSCEDNESSGLICHEVEDMHWYEGVTNHPFIIETWTDGTWGEVALTYDPDTNSCHEAFVLRHGFCLLAWIPQF